MMFQGFSDGFMDASGRKRRKVTFRKQMFDGKSDEHVCLWEGRSAFTPKKRVGVRVVPVAVVGITHVGEAC